MEPRSAGDFYTGCLTDAGCAEHPVSALSGLLEIEAEHRVFKIFHIQ